MVRVRKNGRTLQYAPTGQTTTFLPYRGGLSVRPVVSAERYGAIMHQ